MNLNQFAKEVNQNAVEHGFWEGERNITETIVLIHSEWSEALEEYRDARPMHYYNLDAICVSGSCSNQPDMGPVICEADHCEYGRKPEGIAVELIDGCIRILDLAGEMNYPLGSVNVKRAVLNAPVAVDKMNETQLIAMCHMSTSTALHCFIQNTHDSRLRAMSELVGCVFYVFRWLKVKGIDYEAIIKEKHEYNKTRPYKHGKRC